MALFKTAKRSRSPQGKKDRAASALDLMAGLCGYWTGRRRVVDPDERVTSASPVEARSDFSVLFELSPEGTHVIAHNDGRSAKRDAENFDVWGPDATTGELVRTIFTDGARQSNAYEISRLETNRRRDAWHIVMETVSWDEARPCEIRYEMSRNRKQLNLALSRRLISQGTDYELVSRANLVRQR